MPFAGRLLAFGKRQKTNVMKGLRMKGRRSIKPPVAGAKMVHQASSWADTNTLWFIVDRCGDQSPGSRVSRRTARTPTRPVVNLRCIWHAAAVRPGGLWKEHRGGQDNVSFDIPTHMPIRSIRIGPKCGPLRMEHP